MKKVEMLGVAMILVWLAMVQVANTQEGAPSDQARQKMASDELRAAVQEICPVTGQKLGAHGKPIKAKFGQEEVFLCCEGCLQEKVNKDHWNTIHSNVAKAQARCPVMGKSLPKTAKSTIVEGRIVYICCPPCAKKIEADPKAYLQKVDEFYAASIKARQKKFP